MYNEINNENFLGNQFFLQDTINYIKLKHKPKTTTKVQSASFCFILFIVDVAGHL